MSKTCEAGRIGTVFRVDLSGGLKAGYSGEVGVQKQMTEARRSEGPLGTSIGHQVYRLHRGLRSEFERRLIPFDLTPLEWSILALCEPGPIAPAHLAARLEIDRAAVTRTIDPLVRKGHLERHPHPTDRRSIVIDLTDSGRDLLPRLVAQSQAAQDVLLGHLDDRDRDDLLRILLRANNLRVSSDHNI